MTSPLLLKYQVQFWYLRLKKKKKRNNNRKKQIHGRMTNMVSSKLLPSEKQSQHAEVEQEAITRHLSFPIVLSRPGARKRRQTSYKSSVACLFVQLLKPSYSVRQEFQGMCENCNSQVSYATPACFQEKIYGEKGGTRDRSTCSTFCFHYF